MPLGDLIETDQEHPGPRVLGHEPIVAPKQREALVNAVDGDVVNFRSSRDPALPIIRNPTN